MPWTGTIMLVAPLTGWLTKRLGRRAVVFVGMLAQAAALVWIGALAATAVPYVSLLPAYLLAGAGMGLALAPVMDAAMSAIAGPQQGQASSVLNTVRQLGGAFGIALLGAIFGLVAPTAGQFLDGFRVAIFVGAGMLTLGGFLALLLEGTSGPHRGYRARPCREQRDPSRLTVIAGMTLEELERCFIQAVVDDYQQAWDPLQRQRRAVLWAPQPAGGQGV